MIKLNVGLLFSMVVCQLFVNTTFAQYSGERNSYNSDYNRARREVQKEYEVNADRNRQPNSPAGNYNVSLSKEELQAIVDNLRKSAGKLTDAELKVIKEKKNKELDKKHQEYLKREAASRAIWEKELQTDREDAAPINASLKKGGFLDIEAERMAKNYVLEKKYNNKNNSQFSDYLFEANDNLQFLKQNITTADYSILLYTTAKLVLAKSTITANDFLDIIELRFPEKQEETDLFRANLFANYFLEYTYAGASEYSGFGKRMLDSYFVFEDRNPSFWRLYKSQLKNEVSTWYSPYKSICSYYQGIIASKKVFTKKEVNDAIEQNNYFTLRLWKLEAAEPGVPNTINFYTLLVEKENEYRSYLKMEHYSSKFSTGDWNQTGYFKEDDGAYKLVFGLLKTNDNASSFGKFDGNNGFEGMKVLNDGTIYQGRFEDGFKEGKFKVVAANGFYKTGNFKKNIEQPGFKYYNPEGNETVPDDSYFPAKIYVIADKQFASAIRSDCPACINWHNELLEPAKYRTFLNVDGSKIKDITGIAGFTNLEVLRCRDNKLTFLPGLPRGLKKLDCAFNKIEKVAALPPSLEELDCCQNNLYSLPALPGTLRKLLIDEKIKCLPNKINGLRVTDLRDQKFEIPICAN